jgi:hypothetical protein
MGLGILVPRHWLTCVASLALLMSTSPLYAGCFALGGYCFSECADGVSICSYQNQGGYCGTLIAQVYPATSISPTPTSTPSPTPTPLAKLTITAKKNVASALIGAVKYTCGTPAVVGKQKIWQCVPS